MRINIAKLKAAGFQVHVEEDKNNGGITAIDVYPTKETNAICLERDIRQLISDPALATYAVDAALTAIQRAQILSLCD